MRKNKGEYYKIVFAMFLLVCWLPSTVFGGTKVDLSSNKVIGQNGGFYFKIPISWENYVTAERESSKGQAFVDKINFYYEPRDNGNSRLFLMTLNVYKSGSKLNGNGETIILTTNDLIFTAVYNNHNPYESVNDRIIFGRFLVELSSENFISNKIIILNSSNDDRYNTIIVNNQFLDDYSVVEYNNELYLPLRGIGLKLGYEIRWNPITKIVKLVKGARVIKVDASGTTNHKVVYVGGNIYMPVNFYMQKFNVNIEIDARNNVKIKG